MKILSYKFSDVVEPGWDFQEARFGKINLLVGQSATGKTRLLNTIFNLRKAAVSEESIRSGHWEIEVEQDGKKYSWLYETGRDPSGNNFVKVEQITLSGAKGKRFIVKRKGNDFIFDGKNIPKLHTKQTSIFLLQEEKLIKPLFKGFSSIIRRRFFENEMNKQGEAENILSSDEEKFKKERNGFVKGIFLIEKPIAYRHYFLRKFSPKIQEKICSYFTTVFPFVKKIDLIDVRDVYPQVKAKGLKIKGFTPVFCIREKNVARWISYIELSRGMQKVLLMLTDIATMPRGSIYLIDEYENSLGVNAIDFFPSFLEEIEEDYQFIITSHHPYLINSVDPKNWHILYREGSIVKISSGEVNVQKFGKSKQKAFIQLLNDPFFAEGIE